MIFYSRTSLLECHDYLMTNMQRHYEEVMPEVFPEKISLDLNQVIYLEEAKTFLSVKAVKENKIVGLIAGYVYNHLQHKNNIFATTCVLMANPDLAKERRRVVKGLVDNFEKYAIEDFGAQFVQIGLSAGNDIRKLLEHWGYKQTDYIVTKRIN